MSWQAITDTELLDEINGAVNRMTAQQLRLWNAIRINPEKWSQNPYGTQGGGFWAVALLGQTVVWYNDVEEGFNTSRYVHYGAIDEYWCNQDELEWTIQHLLDGVEFDQNEKSNLRPPEVLQ